MLKSLALSSRSGSVEMDVGRAGGFEGQCVCESTIGGVSHSRASGNPPDIRGRARVPILHANSTVMDYQGPPQLGRHQYDSQVANVGCWRGALRCCHYVIHLEQTALGQVKIVTATAAKCCCGLVVDKFANAFNGLTINDRAGNSRLRRRSVFTLSLIHI